MEETGMDAEQLAEIVREAKPVSALGGEVADEGRSSL